MKDLETQSLLGLTRGLRQAWFDIVNSRDVDDPKMTGALARWKWDEVGERIVWIEIRVKQIQGFLELMQANAEAAKAKAAEGELPK